MNDTLIFIVWFGAILLVLFSVGIIIFFGVVLYQQQASAYDYGYEQCLNETIDPGLCDVLFPPIPLQAVNWTIPFP